MPASATHRTQSRTRPNFCQLPILAAVAAPLLLVSAALSQLPTRPAATARTAPSPRPAPPLPPAKPTQVQPAASSQPAATAAPHAYRARVEFSGNQLSITAENSSLNEILSEISRLTGMKITGGVADERVYGSYGQTPRKSFSTNCSTAPEPTSCCSKPRNTPWRNSSSPHATEAPPHPAQCLAR